MKILVTGATGFIGNHVLNELTKIEKYEIIASSTNEEKAKSFNWYNKVEYKEFDINSFEGNPFQYFNSPDLLIHLAWQGLPNFKELYHFKRNVQTNFLFVEEMIKNGLKNLSVTGTCFEYGMQSGPLSEDLETKPVTAYGLGKDTLRKWIEKLKDNYEFNFKWIRLFYTYGEGQSPKSIIPQLHKSLDNGEDVFNMSGGEQLRDYLPVETVAKYIVNISMQNKVTGIINCCSGDPISIRRLIEEQIRMSKKEIKLNLGYYPYPDYVPLAFWGDDTKLKKIFE